MDDQKILAIPYIVAGPLFPNAKEKIAPESLELVTGKFVFLKSGLKADDYTLKVTDEAGVLRSVGNDLVPLQPKQHSPKDPLTFYIVPPGFARTFFFTGNAKWQSELLNVFRELAKDEKPITARCIIFEKKHLKVPESDELKEAFDKQFKEGKQYCGQLIQKAQAAQFLVSKSIFEDTFQKRTTVSDPNCFPMLKNGNSNTIELLDKFKSLPPGKNPQPANSDLAKEFELFFITSNERPVAEGLYLFSIPKTILNPGLKQWCSDNGVPSISFHVDVKFSMPSLAGDFDFHLLDPISLEEAVFTQYPEKFGDLKKRLTSPETEAPDPALKKEKAPLETWIKRYEFAKKKIERVTGILEAKPKDLEEKIRKETFALLADYFNVGKQRDPELVDTINLISANFDLISDGFKIGKNWKKLVKDKFPALEKTLQQITDQKGFFKNSFQKTALLKWARNNESDFIRRLVALNVPKFQSESNYAAKAMQLILLDGYNPRMSATKKMLKITGRTLAVMDTAVSIYNTLSLIKAHGELKDTKVLYLGRFDEGAKNYQTKFPNAPSHAGMLRLEALRKLCDTCAVELSENERELLNAAIDTMLSVAVFIPVVDVFAGAILAVKATLESAGAIVGTITNDIDRLFLDMLWTQLQEKERRLNVLEQENTANLDAIRSKKESPDSPATQFRVRAAVIAGLARLIERCGSRFGAEAEQFEKRVKKYKIEEYINTFILSPVKETPLLPLMTQIPLDELWLYQVGYQGPALASEVQRTARFFKEHWYGIPFLITPPAVPVVTALTIASLSRAPSVPIQFQRTFPIHHQDSATIQDLARALCTNRTGIKKADILLAQVNAKALNGSWVSVEDYLKDSRNPPITPVTPIRVVVVLKGDNLEGMPVSIQLHRSKLLLSNSGPKYKCIAAKLTASKDNKGDDKGLLTSTIEEQYISTKDKSYFGCVLHPFYIFNDAVFLGIKPFDYIPLTYDPSIDVFFRVGAGDRADFNVKTGLSGKMEFRVRLPLKSELFCKMIIDKVFLANKSSNATVYPVLTDNLLQSVLCGIMVRKGSAWRYYNDRHSLTSGTEFDFSWNSTFEIIFLFSAFSFREEWLDGPTIEFPVSVCAYEKEILLDFQGPTYTAEAVLLNKNRKFELAPATGEVERMLKEWEIIRPADMVQWAPKSEQSLFKDKRGFLFAVRSAFAYTVEDDAGNERIYNRLKPFGDDYLAAAAGDTYKYRFTIEAQPFGLRKLETGYLHFPGLPDPASATKLLGFPLNKKFVTAQQLKREIAIQRSDFM